MLQRKADGRRHGLRPSERVTCRATMPLVVPMSLASTPRSGGLRRPRRGRTKPQLNSARAQTTGRARLPPEVRRAQILDAAEALLQAHGGLPLPLDELGRAAGI